MIISLGEGLIDFVGSGRLSFDGFPGGSPFNTAIVVSRLGTDCSFMGRISTDLFGQQLIEYLEENSVGTDLIQRTSDSTTLSFVQKQADGTAVYAFFPNGSADRSWTQEEIDRIVLPEEARIIHFGSISLSQEPCGSSITGFLEKNHKRVMLSYDPNIRPSLVHDRNKYMGRFLKLCSLSSVIKLSDEDLSWLYPEMDMFKAAEHLLESGISLVALTAGRSGAWMITENNRVLSPMFDLPVSDTIGAGDTFHGAMLSYLHEKNWLDRNTLAGLDEKQLRDLGDYANRAAGINCHRSGANPPTAAEMEEETWKQRP